MFDKTGTLTEGKFQVIEVESKAKDKMLRYAALAESFSKHPIALAITDYVKVKNKKEKLTNVKEIAGKGISIKIDGKDVLVGNEKLLKENKIEFESVNKVGTIIYVAVEKNYLGYLVIADKVKEDVPKILKDLKEKEQMKEFIMLTGDKTEIANEIAKEVGVDKVYSELLPQDKVEKIEKILQAQKDGKKVAFVGDGMNDAPVLTRADIGIAMGALGSDAAIEAADVVIMDDNISKISTAIKISKRTICIVKQNIYFAIGIKLFFLLLGALGVANMMEAVFADVGVSVIAILNSMRALNTKRLN